MHLYLPLRGEQMAAQLEKVVELRRANKIDHILIGGGWCFGADYKRTSADAEPVFSPQWIKEELSRRGVQSENDAVVAAAPYTVRHWSLNVVSTWGEVKQMHHLLRRLCHHFSGYQRRPLRIFFVGVDSHMDRAKYLWRWYNGLMSMFGHGIRLRYIVVPLDNRMGEAWAKGEPMRNLIAYIDPFGVGPAFLIHLKRRFDARRACPGQHN